MLLPSLLTFLAIAAVATAIPTPEDPTIIHVARANKVASAPLSKRTDHSGLGTVYLQEGGTTSCGGKYADSAVIGALGNFWQLGQSPGPKCGRKIVATNTGSNDGVGGKGNSIEVTIQDTCASCDENHVDFSLGAWNRLTNNAPLGTFDLTWHFCNTNGVC